MGEGKAVRFRLSPLTFKQKDMTTNQKALSRINPAASVTEKTTSVGGGEWSLEVYADDIFVCEYVGSNGTHGESDDLWALYRADWRAIEAAKKFLGMDDKTWFESVTEADL
jgi:hypothetical protein